jgi:hypothetical protein
LTKLPEQVSHPHELHLRLAKYALDNLNKEKNAISKVVAQKKKDSKGQDKCEEEIA